VISSFWIKRRKYSEVLDNSYGRVKMWDILLEFLAYLGIRAFKKKKREEADLTSSEAVDLDKDLNHSGGGIREGVPVCAGCSRNIEKGAIYELGKAWCASCYKTHVLKVQE
jgi:hypothetical protein